MNINYELVSWLIYGNFSFLWAAFAVRMQYELRGNVNLITVFFLNLIGAPIAMIIAIVLCRVGKEEPEIDGYVPAEVDCDE